MQDSQILAFQCGREFLTYSTEFNACHDKSIRSFFDQFCVFIDGGVRVCVGPWRGFKFSVPQKLSFRAFSSRRSGLTQIFVVTRGSEIAVRRDSYLNLAAALCLCPSVNLAMDLGVVAWQAVTPHMVFALAWHVTILLQQS